MKISISRHSFLLLAVMLLMPFMVQGAVPSGYYKSAYNKKQSELKTALYNIISPHQQVSSYNNLPSYFRQTDVRPGTQYWWDMYSDMDVDIYVQFGTYMNREHSLPKSWWGGNTSTPAYVDLYHLYPGEARANQAKSNYPLGEISGNPSFTNGVSMVGTGVNSGGASRVFEPADEYKGDFARTYFYMVTAYQDMNWVTTWQVRNGAYPSLQQWAIDLLLKWHRADPVSQKELLRNEAVYKIQTNRNPFIDYPDLAEYIWGNKQTQSWNPESGSTDPDAKAEITAPINGMTLDFGEVAIGKTGTSQLLVKGANLTSNVTISIAGNDKQYFTSPEGTVNAMGATTISVPASRINAESGTWIPLTYTPTVTGDHTSNFVVLGGGYSGSIRVYMKGTGMPVPTLTKPLSPEATDVTPNSYVARWTAPSNEVIDYYVVTRTIYKGNSVTTKQEMAETDTLQVEDFSDADRESFTVHGVRLGYDSPESDVVIVNRPSAIDRIDTDEVPFTIESYPGFVRVRCSTPQSGLTVYDMSGCKVREITTTVDDGFEFTLPCGVYIVVTPEHGKPVKAVGF